MPGNLVWGAGKKTIDSAMELSAPVPPGFKQAGYARNMIGAEAIVDGVEARIAIRSRSSRLGTTFL